MSAGSAALQQAVSFLNLPTPIAYGKVRGTGLFSIQQEVADKTRYLAIVHGQGPWSAVTKCWVNRKVFDHADTAKYHFHPGGQGVIGDGMAATSTGADQKVDLFFASLPGALSLIGYSDYCYSFLKVAPDLGAPSADIEFLADFDALRCRQFDTNGVLTAFSFTENPAWWILDSIIRKFIKREQKFGKDWAEPLTTEEKNRIDFTSFYDASVYYDADIGGGIKRFSGGGMVTIADGTVYVQALEQKLLMCRSYILERNGKIALYPDKARASVFTFTLDKMVGGFKANKSLLRGAKNQVLAAFNDLNAATGDSGDGETKFAIASPEPLNHEAHQRATGARGKGLSVIPRIDQVKFDLGNNTSERAWRIAQSYLLRQLGDDADPGNIYRAPFRAEFGGVEESMKVEPGEVLTVEKGVSEEFGGRDYEILEQEIRPDGTVGFTALEYMPNAFPDAAPTQQTLETPAPGTGIVPVSGGGSYSYRTLKNVLRAHDAGANVTLYVEDPDTNSDFTNRVAGLGDLVITAGTITAQSYSTLVHVYYTDLGNPPTGGAKTFGTAATKEEALNGLGRFYLGSIITPAAGGADTRGFNDSGAGAQIGGHIRKRATVETFGGTPTQTGQAIDGDWATFAYAARDNTDITGLTDSLVASGFTPATETDKYYRGGKLKVKGKVFVTNESDAAGGATSNLYMEYSVNGGSSWTTIRTSTCVGAGTIVTLVLQTDTVSLTDGFDPSKVQVRARAVGHTGGAANDGFLDAYIYEAELEADF